MFLFLFFSKNFFQILYIYVYVFHKNKLQCLLKFWSEKYLFSKIFVFRFRSTHTQRLFVSYIFIIICIFFSILFMYIICKFVFYVYVFCITYILLHIVYVAMLLLIFIVNIMSYLQLLLFIEWVIYDYYCLLLFIIVYYL